MGRSLRYKFVFSRLFSWSFLLQIIKAWVEPHQTYQVGMALKKNSPYHVFFKHVVQKFVERGQLQWSVMRANQENSMKTCSSDRRYIQG